ncbi:glycoside hydrolase domain-containing protein [Nonomuraea sp. NPDC049419]|uniref:glycoside hydrolase domain-containing protein n=1 Tax=Nonomuraea sp. NPDC049419 TaxID=3155772 RepID=UPI003413B3D9
MDEMVLRAQRFINTTYGSVPGITKVVEDGITGWATMYALTRCLQHQLGITTLSNNFGPTTLSTLTSQWPSITRSAGAPANLVRILQSGLYCKGYDGGEIDGIYNDRVSAAVQQLKANSGTQNAFPGDAMVPKLFKALLTMDAYVVTANGSASIRSIQQWMNSRYVNRTNFFVIPCDGHFSRDVQKAMMLACQFELGQSDGEADGIFGPKTLNGLAAQGIAQGSTGVFVQLFSAAMIFNRRQGTAFTATYDANLTARVVDFQNFARLAPTGTGDKQTWASLLVSTGDSSRRGTAADCVTQITPARAQTLKGLGYQVVGRYLTNVPNTSLNKKIQPGELAVIAQEGLRVFPIYQTYGGAVTYFNATQGAADAMAALDAARGYGFKPGTRIYFAVDYDALDSDVTSNILPHFRAIRTRFNQLGSEYAIGIYGPRNVCSRVAAEGLSTASFVAGMSTGFSGNLGFPLPDDWAFDQISTITIGAGDGAIEIDNNINSGRDSGQNSFNDVPTGAKPDVPFSSASRDAILTELLAYIKSLGDLPEGNVLENAWLYLTPASLDITLQHDALITALSRAFGMRKALIQTPLFWELRNNRVDDAAVDGLVVATYAYLEAYELWEENMSGPPPQPPIIMKNDSSTGLGQIFADTAIKSRNYCVSVGIISDSALDPADWHDVWRVWKQLKDDDEYSVSTIPLVNIWGAADIGQRRPVLDYTENEAGLILKRYNGTGAQADVYRQKTLPIYRIFEKYNSAARNL